MKKSIKITGLTTVAAVAVLSLAACSTSGSSKTSSSSSSEKAVTLHYSAAASLQKSLTTIYSTYHKAHPNVTIDFDFAGSGAIREKVVAGAPIDGVFLASKSDTTTLTNAKKATDAQAVLGNTLDVIAPKDSKLSSSENLSDLIKGSKKIAIGEAATVPAGKYATQTMTKLNVLTEAQPKFVMGSDVTSVLNYVASGNADLGFVYKTDAMSSSKVKVLQEVPADLHDKITYYTATVSDTKNAAAVKAFDQYLTQSDAQKVFAKAGFSSAK